MQCRISSVRRTNLVLPKVVKPLYDSILQSSTNLSKHLQMICYLQTKFYVYLGDILFRLVESGEKPCQCTHYTVESPQYPDILGYPKIPCLCYKFPCTTQGSRQNAKILNIIQGNNWETAQISPVLAMIFLFRICKSAQYLL